MDKTVTNLGDKLMVHTPRSSLFWDETLWDRLDSALYNNMIATMRTPLHQSLLDDLANSLRRDLERATGGLFFD